MDQYYKKSEWEYKVLRVLTDLNAPVHGENSVQDKKEFVFDNFSSSFEFYEKMYRMDKEVFEYLTKTQDSLGFCDRSKLPGMYTFIFRGKMLMVKLVNLQEVANDVFQVEEK